MPAGERPPPPLRSPRPPPPFPPSADQHDSVSWEAAREAYDAFVFPRYGRPDQRAVPVSLGYDGRTNLTAAEAAELDAFCATNAREFFAMGLADGRFVGQFPFHYNGGVTNPDGSITGSAGIVNLPKCLATYQVSRRGVANPGARAALRGMLRVFFLFPTTDTLPCDPSTRARTRLFPCASTRHPCESPPRASARSSRRQGRQAPARTPPRAGPHPAPTARPSSSPSAPHRCRPRPASGAGVLATDEMGGSKRKFINGVCELIS
jgi:hypothetical protein